jgi:predicted ATP-grasp superfamily ATP-dependent carboligase
MVNSRWDKKIFMENKSNSKMKRFFIVEPLSTSFGYFEILAACRSQHSLDIEIHAVFVNKKDTYPYIPLVNFIDKIWFIQQESPIIDENDVLIAASDDGVEFVGQYRSSTMVRHNKANYLSRISAPHRIDDFHLSLPENSIDDALEWIQDRLPVFLKPVNGTGSQNVYCVFSIIEAREMLKYITSELQIKELVIQKKVVGKEIQIDLSSCGEDLAVTGIWTARRGPRTFSYLENYDDFDLAFKASLESLLNELPKIDSIYGLYHIETIFDGQDLKVIEINFRRHGHINHLAYSTGMGRSQIEADVISHLWPEMWYKIFENKFASRRNYVARCWIRNRVKKFIHFDIDSVKGMPSVSGVIPHSQLFNRIVDPSNEFAG